MLITNSLKALAIFAVVTLHVLAAKSDISLNLNLFLRFSVPLFIALSGFGLAKKYHDKIDIKDYYIKRVFKLLPWYIFWSGVIYIYLHLTTPFWKLLLSGSADYHLYFVPLILKFYLLFPLLWLAVKKFPKVILITALVIQLWWYYQTPSLGISDQEQYRNLISWIFYFFLGMFVTQKETILQKSFRLKMSAVILTVAGFIWTILVAGNLKNQGVDPIVYTRFTQIPIIFYSTGLILTGLSLAPYLSTRLPVYLSTLLRSVGEYSYIIYLCHTLVLRVLVEKTNFISNLSIVQATFVVFILAYFLAYSFSHLRR